MKYKAHRYNEDLIIEADYFVILPYEVPQEGSWNPHARFHDVVFYRDNSLHPVAFVHQPYSVTEIEEEPEVSES